jgi:RNA polymerase sigma factor (sigma-70 family)
MHGLFEGGTVRGVPTRQLLDRFVRRKEEVAFEAIVALHGPMVLGVCRRVLRDPCDIEDAFQATFLVLVRKASTIGDGDLLETWLYKVATRVALRVRAESARRRAREQAAAAPSEASAVTTGPETNRDELRPALDEEIGRLPEKYRAPLVLFYFQGLSQAETARRLGCPAGTVGSRLARARERLRGRLIRRGLAPSAGLLGTVLSAEVVTASASVPTALAMRAVRAATSVSAGPGVSLASISVTALAAGVLRAMAWARAVTVAAVVSGLAVAALGVAALLQGPSMLAVRAEPPSVAKAEPSLPAVQTGTPAAKKGAGPALIDEKTERAIKSGLAWLADQQHEDGSFGMGTFEGSIAHTSLAALALLEAGSERGHGPYRVRVEKALRYVMRSARPSGFLQVPDPKATHGPMYHHAFGVLFLSQVYNQGERPEVRDTLAKAVRLIVDTQNREGGWRYQPVRADADLSVTVCQLNALRAARRAGMEVPDETFNACIRYVKNSQNPDGGFRYMLQGGASAFPRSAGGLMALLSAGGSDSKEVREGLNYLRQYMRAIKLGSRYSHYFYGHYYAAQAMKLRGGDDWNEWYTAIRDELLRRQAAAGYWADSIGNDYGTAMALFILQMPRSQK